MFGLLWRALWRYRLLLGCVLGTVSLFHHFVGNGGGVWGAR